MKTPIQITLFLIVYLNLSAIEYVSHRWIMHSHKDSSPGLFWKIFGKEATDHQLHHTSKQPDMTLGLSSLEDEKSGLFSVTKEPSSTFLCFTPCSPYSSSCLI